MRVAATRTDRLVMKSSFAPKGDRSRRGDVAATTSGCFPGAAPDAAHVLIWHVSLNCDDQLSRFVASGKICSIIFRSVLSVT